MFERMAICNAYYMFASLYHSGQDSKEYAIFGRLQKLGYKPGLAASSHNPERLDETSREIFDQLVARHEQPKKTKRTLDRANRILVAAMNEAEKSGNWKIKASIEGIQLHYNGYAEPGYTDPEHGLVATGNWNKITHWVNTSVFTINDLANRVGNLFEKLGIPCEWEDEWVECSHCGKIVRSQPDSMSWKPSYILGDGELWCVECDPELDSDNDSVE